MEPVLAHPSKAFTLQITELRHEANACIERVKHAKSMHVHFKTKEGQQAVHQMKSVIDTLETIYKNFKEIQQEPKTIARALRNVIQITLDLTISERIANLITSVEVNSPEELYTALDSAVETIIAMADPAKTQHEKFEILNTLCDQHSLELADSSPRRMGVLLLELMKFAIEKFISTLKIANEPVQQLQKKLEQHIDDRRTFISNSTPRYESSLKLQVASKVHNDQREALIQKAIACRKPIAFWGQFPFSSRVLRYVRRWSECERYGDLLERELGSPIGGLLEKIRREFQKVVEAKITPGQAEEFSHKIDTYIACYKFLKDNLKHMRKNIYTLNPDVALLPLLRYTSELRFALSEIAVTIDTLKKHSSAAALSIFCAVKVLGKQRTLSKAKTLVDFALQDEAGLRRTPYLHIIAESITHVLVGKSM